MLVYLIFIGIGGVIEGGLLVGGVVVEVLISLIV